MKSSEFKKCPNGHYYKGDYCPYCKTENRGAGEGEWAHSTDAHESNKGTSDMTTDISGGVSCEPKTKFSDPGFGMHNPVSSVPGYGPENRPTKRTVFAADEETADESAEDSGTGTDTGTITGRKSRAESGEKHSPYRSFRKLVGWLVTYSFDASGVDYKIYEGRNIIGRDAGCNITVADPLMSGTHAVLLYRDNKFIIEDNMSSNGTYVNEENIDIQKKYLNDGDVIRMGATIFKFRTAF